MAENIQEIFWMLDARTRNTIYVNRAYETIIGRSCQSLQTNPSSYEEAIHPEDRSHVLGKLQEATQSGQFDERFRIVRPDGEIRWIAVRGFPVRDFDGRISRLVGTAQEITAQKQAEDQVIKNLTIAENAWAESEALRKATLALTQDLRMDFVLDALLQSLTDLISCDCARIWLLEGDTRLFVAREKVRRETSKEAPDLSPNARRRRHSPFAKNPRNLASGSAPRHEGRARLANVHRPYPFALMALCSFDGIATHSRSSLGRPHAA